MIPEYLRRALAEFREGKRSSEDMERLLEHLPYEDLDFAKVDHHRALRHGFAEVIFGKGKTTAQILTIADAILAKHPNLLITHTGKEVFEDLSARVPETEFHALSRVVAVVRDRQPVGRGTIGIVAAGTADIPVAEEAAVTAQVMGNEVLTWNDVGVAGIHRVLRQVEALRSCTVIIAVAGMEGALPSVVGGLVEVPVIAVPTSIGYGASFGGLAALLGMLNSCSSNVTVVNIDNGFGAGYVASLINRRHPVE